MKMRVHLAEILQCIVTGLTEFQSDTQFDQGILIASLSHEADAQ
ncbi:hypothetical protein FB106_12714 [Synechococcus sp. Ace-Pa]|nr:hypothetical protein [Synechococcus sp. Ace-Pa]TWB87053.1 hypothetical protein FB106_12714 [Synechococcus sp. Ace-Pa]